mgnify:CR=1 FL=1
MSEIEASPRPEYTIPVRGGKLRMGRRTLLMGIVNVTPDSFSDGGDFLETEIAVLQGLKLAEEGADILDVGGESTRPGSHPIDPDEELRRVLPVIEGLRVKTDIPISIDTYKSPVARKALEAGADIINDIFGFQGDPEMPGLAAEHQCPAVLMHIRGVPKTMNDDTAYEDLIGEMIAYLRNGIDLGVKAGLPRENFVIDPGIGFAKRHQQNLEILSRLHEFNALNCPILVGPSRKSFIGQTIGVPPKERIFGTAASVAMSAARGAHILRVHDLKEMRQVLDVVDAILCPDVSETS